MYRKIIGLGTLFISTFLPATPTSMETFEASNITISIPQNWEKLSQEFIQKTKDLTAHIPGEQSNTLLISVVRDEDGSEKAKIRLSVKSLSSDMVNYENDVKLLTNSEKREIERELAEAQQKNNAKLLPFNSYQYKVFLGSNYMLISYLRNGTLHPDDVWEVKSYNFIDTKNMRTIVVTVSYNTKFRSDFEGILDDVVKSLVY